MCTTVGFDASCGTHGTFLIDLCRAMSKIWSPQDLSTLPKIFQPILQTVKGNWASWCPLDCLEKQGRAFQVMFGRKHVVWPRYSLDVEIFCQLVLPFGKIQCDSHHPENCLGCVSHNNPQHLPCSCNLLWVAGKIF